LVTFQSSAFRLVCQSKYICSYIVSLHFNCAFHLGTAISRDLCQLI